MRRFLEKYVSKYFDVGYPVDTNPNIIYFIDNVVKQTNEPVMIITIKNNNSQSETYKIYKNISFDEIIRKLDKYSSTHSTRIFDDTWAKSKHIGFFVEFKSTDSEIKIRIFNLDNDLEAVTQLFDFPL